MHLDARIPLSVVPCYPQAVEGTAVVAPVAVPGAAAWRPPAAGARTAGHRGACPCCVGRSPVAAALDALFLDRARGAVPFFAAALVVDADPASAHAALALDAVVTARYRLLPL
jgi:hypothetical protein